MVAALPVIVSFDAVVRYALLDICGLFVCNCGVCAYYGVVARLQKADWYRSGRQSKPDAKTWLAYIKIGIQQQRVSIISKQL